ncbi:MAG: aldo/keto reductase [Planctomycetaceae bacterium]
MKRRRLGGSGITVSEICMGTMTFGSQCDESLSFRIMDRAFDAGIDFYDAAEMYPVPPTVEAFGRTEEIVGRWLKTKPREAVIVATKITGPAHGWFVPPVRHGHSALDRLQIIRAVEASLRRLQTDYIDLYQTHWPDHGMRYEDILEPLTRLVQQGKIRALGCSNETCWGLMKSLAAAERGGLCRYDSVQNNFSLINRRCESELAQVCRRENVSLLPFSPLGGGVLTGKYQKQDPPGARFTEYRRLGERQQRLAERFLNDRTRETVQRLQLIAADLNVPLAALAVAWSKQHDFVASTIIGATNVAQLEENLLGTDLLLDQTILRRINEIDEMIPNPMKEDGLRRL